MSATSLRIRVLLVQNDHAAAAPICDVLRQAGYVPECETIQTEGDLRTRVSQPVDLIIVDHAVAGWSVRQMLNVLTELRSDVPLIVLAEEIDEAAIVECLRNGAADFVSKPRIERLGPAVQRALTDRSKRYDNRQTEEELQKSNQRLASALVELQRTQQRIIERERLRALGQMASGIAHDFNNALTQVLGYAEILLEVRPEEITDPEKVRSYLTWIRAAANDAADVVGRLREFYRYRDNEEHLETVLLARIVEQSIELTQPRWKDQALAEGINIVIQTDVQNTPPVIGHEAELREMLTNLILNALDAMPHGGTLFIGTHIEGDSSVLEIRDSGVGMAADVRDHCFEPFFTTKGASGTGLGLAAVYGVVRRHSGSIDVESAPGQGTTFTIRLPARKSGPFAARSNRTLDVPPRPLQILIVDDEESIRSILVALLERDGHRVVTAVDGRDGLRKLKKEAFDLVVTDRLMPKLSGDQLAAQIKKRHPNLPVILLSGFGDAMLATGEHPPGIDVVVGKPVNVDTLRQAIYLATDIPESE
ncbi:MAG TPA: response regulator [Chloroflexota bacterium]|nr:response regulator [Chloroflexota bacterium]